MSSLRSLLLHPMLSIGFWVEDGNGESGIDVFYLLTLFFATGIWLVVKRYQKKIHGAVDFFVEPPEAADPNWRSFQIQNPHLRSHEDSQNDEIRPALYNPGTKYITSFDPATGLHIETYRADTKDEIADKIERAVRAQQGTSAEPGVPRRPGWHETNLAQRRKVIRSLKKWLVENQDTCARVACRDTGKTLVDAALGEIMTTCSKMEWILKHGQRALRPEKRSTNLLLFYKNSTVHYEPLGVVAAIVSWNYPLHNAWSPILAAIFSGNGIVLKCSENVIWSTTWFVKAIKEALRVCGHNEDLVQLVCCYPEEATALTESKYIKHITFIGSETVGRQVAIAATKHLTPVTLELGGKDPAIILPRTDLKQWASLWLRGIFQNAGQNCIGIERLIVHSSQHDELYDLLVDRIQKLRLGSVLAPSPGDGFIHTVDCGSMISDNRFESLELVIRHAQEDGATVEGGLRHRHVYHEEGAYFRPTIVANATQDMEIAKEEIFAPVALLMKYRDVDEAVEIANGTEYGLGASVFGPDQRDCIAVAKRLECGMVSVNDFGVFYLNQDLPFGGTKASGYGRFGGSEGLRALTNPKAIIVDRVPWLIQTKIPKVLDYPIRSLVQSWDFVSGLVSFAYADGWRASMRGLILLVKAARK